MDAPGSSPVSPEQWQHFELWCKEEALAVRHRAAAMGEPVEYAFLRTRHILAQKMGELFPGWQEHWVDKVWHAAEDDRRQLSLEAINSLRAETKYPPLKSIPVLVVRCDFPVPMP